MGTPFREIYTIFMSQITSYPLLEILEEEGGEEALDKNLQFWLMRATSFFENCRQDLNDYDPNSGSFNVSLTMTEKQILAQYMLLTYLNTHLIDTNLLKQKLNSKDYRQYSEQGLIKAIIEIKVQLDAEVQVLLSRYSWTTKRVKDLFK